MTDVKLFFIGDYFLISDGFAATFNSENDGIRVTGKARNVPEAFEMIHSGRIDVIVLDLNIRHDDPVGNIRKLKKEFPAIPVIAISTEISLDYKFMMYREGVRALMINPDDKNTTKAVILQVAAGNSVIPADVMNLINLDKLPVLTDSLIPVEKEIVKLLSCGSTVQDIAFQLKKSKSGVEKILENLRHRLNAKSNCELMTILLKLTEL